MSRLPDLQDCFNADGNLTWDPYRVDPDVDRRYQAVFTEDGYLRDPAALAKLIDRNQWSWRSTAVGLYHADIHASSTKGSYPTKYYFR